MKARKLKIIKRADIDERKSARKAAAASLANSAAALRRRRRTGNAAVSSWITERRETERAARLGLLEMMFRARLPGGK